MILNMLSIIHDKRAVSPLVATFITAILALLLGAISMNFIDDLPLQPLSCEQHMDLKILTVNDQERICINNETRTIYYVLENKGPVKIEGYKVLLIGNYSSTFERQDDSIDIYATKADSIEYEGFMGDIRMIEFKPYIDAGPGRGKTSCQRSILIIYDMAQCDIDINSTDITKDSG